MELILEPKLIWSESSRQTGIDWQIDDRMALTATRSSLQSRSGPRRRRIGGGCDCGRPVLWRFDVKIEREWIRRGISSVFWHRSAPAGRLVIRWESCRLVSPSTCTADEVSLSAHVRVSADQCAPSYPPAHRETDQPRAMLFACLALIGRWLSCQCVRQDRVSRLGRLRGCRK